MKKIRTSDEVDFIIYTFFNHTGGVQSIMDTAKVFTAPNRFFNYFIINFHS